VTRVFAAVDLGASSGRVMAGVVDRDSVHLELVHRFPNSIVERAGELHWDLAELYEQSLIGLAQIPDAEAIGIDTWGVDYGLLDERGALVGDPFSYRDDRTTDVIGAVDALVPRREQYATTGTQHLPFNTIYQLGADARARAWDRVTSAVLLPDLIAYWLTGELRTEVTNASTTGLLDARTRAWATSMMRRLSLPEQLFPPLQEPGGFRGTTSDGTVVIAVGTHDTASAVVGVPTTTDRYAYVSSGTWSLVGVELDAPVLTTAARDANFTNEIGVDGRTRFLRNTGGMWLLQECLRAWRDADLPTLIDSAARLRADGPRIDVDDPALLPPGGMPERICVAAGRQGMTEVEITRCILDSLARAYARAIQDAVELSAKRVDVVHLVGGGSQNALLCQLTANEAGIPVIAGPVEATALGNVAVQARAAGALRGSLEAMRATVAKSSSLRRYPPR
jgi:rhamnulokinase